MWIHAESTRERMDRWHEEQYYKYGQAKPVDAKLVARARKIAEDYLKKKHDEVAESG